VATLQDSLKQHRKPVKVSIRQWIAQLDDDDRKAIEAAAVDPGFTNAALVQVMREAGVSVGKDTVAAWRGDHGFARQ